MRVTEDAVWKWLNTKKPHPTPEYMQLLMELLHENTEKRGFTAFFLTNSVKKCGPCWAKNLIWKSPSYSE